MPDLNKAYTWAIETCNGQNIGYSMTYRNQQTVNGITYYDCSSFIWYALLAGGFDCVAANGGSTWPFTTYTMPRVLTALGFTELPASTTIWLPGDINLSTSHTEMTYQVQNDVPGQGITMGAHTNTVPIDDQVSINNYASNFNSFPRLFRYGEGGASGYGYSIYVVAALCGNAWRESFINPGQGEVGGGGFGLFQWTGTRRTALESWLSDNGYAVDSGNGQCQYLIVEDDWQGEFGGIGSLDAFLNSTSTDIAMLTEAFMTCWERPGVPALDERIQHANQCYNYIRQHANDTSITDWIAKDEYLSQSELLNNAVMMYRFYSAGGGGGGSTGRTKGKMPVWMMIRRFY